MNEVFVCIGKEQTVQRLEINVHRANLKPLKPCMNIFELPQIQSEEHVQEFKLEPQILTPPARAPTRDAPRDYMVFGEDIYLEYGNIFDQPSDARNPQAGSISKSCISTVP